MTEPAYSSLDLELEMRVESRDSALLACMLSFFAGTTNQTKDGSVVRKCRVADKSASICFSLWNEQAGAIDAGDILKLTKGLTIIKLSALA